MGTTRWNSDMAFKGSKLLVAKGGVGIGIAPLELVTCSHVFSPQLPLNQTCKLSSPNMIGQEFVGDPGRISEMGN
jgi:hypothetical protein